MIRQQTTGRELGTKPDAGTQPARAGKPSRLETAQSRLGNRVFSRIAHGSNAASAARQGAVVQRVGLGSWSPAALLWPEPRLESIGDEKVWVANDTEKAEAAKIIADLREEHGIAVSSTATLKSLSDLAEEAKVPKWQREHVRQSAWEMKELRAAAKAASNHAPALGPSRERSSLAGTAQGVTTLGRINHPHDLKGDFSHISVMGQYLKKDKSIALYNSASNAVESRYLGEHGRASGSAAAPGWGWGWPGRRGTDPDNATTLEAILTHELAHGIIETIELDNWVETMDYWATAAKPSRKPGAEKPPSRYGEKSAGEDIAESVAMYFGSASRPKLAARCPERAAFVRKVVEAWTPPAEQKALAGASGGGARH